MFTYSDFRLLNVEICAVLSSNVIGLLMLRNCVFRLRNVQIWVVLSWKLVVLLIFTNSVFKLQNVQIWTVTKFKGVNFYCHEWHLQAAKRSDKSSTVLQEGRFAHAQEYRFHGAKR